MNAIATLRRVWRRPWKWTRPFAARPWCCEVIVFTSVPQPIRTYSEHQSRAAAEIAARAAMRAS